MLTGVFSGCGITGEFCFLLGAWIRQGLIREAELLGKEQEVYYKGFDIMQL